MKKYLLFFFPLLFIFFYGKTQSTIADARQASPGSTVTITGVATNGAELGAIRYIQDVTGAIPVYGSNFVNSVNRGDSITVTGTLYDYYNLLEISPITSLTNHSSGHDLPDPVVLTPSELNETYEAQLVQIEHAVLDDAGQVFASKSNYSYTANGQSGEIRIYAEESPLAGTVIPSGEVTIIGVLGQYYSTYQVLPRDENDIIAASSINVSSPLIISSITTSSFFLHWSTDKAGSTGIFYGNTPALELGQLTGLGNVMDHTINITGADPSEVFYVQAFSVLDTDTAKTALQTFITQSESTGEIKVYFNRSVDNSVSIGTDAVYLDRAIDDTLIRYLERAKYTIDFTIYNFNNSGISNITTALNAAHSRGVEVRIVYDSNTDNSGINTVDAGIGKIASPTSDYPIYGIMHNKFVVFDALSTDANDPLVWTGSTNFTADQINTDPNNVIIIQDQSLAKAYRLEFNEMFGSEGLTPDNVNSKFGPDKTDNTPHEFVIGGNRVECWFSPSDGTNSRIIGSIKSAESELCVATMLITRTDIGYAISDMAAAGTTAKVIVNTEANCNETVVNTLKSALGGNFREMGESGIMHHKYLIADPSGTDPQVLTGCHNWSSSAEARNDENTLIIHNATIANIYYQEFTERFGNGNYIIDAPVTGNDYVSMPENDTITFNVIEDDDVPGDFNLTIIQYPNNGSAEIEGDSAITYIPDTGFTGLDTVMYKVCMIANPSLCDSSIMVILVEEATVVITRDLSAQMHVYPNPNNGIFTLSLNLPEIESTIQIRLLNITGKTVFEKKIETGGKNKINVDTGNIPAGLYFMNITVNGININTKVIFNK